VVRTQTKLRSVYMTSDAQISSARSEPPGHEVTSSGGEDVELVVSGDIHGSSSCPTVEIKTRALTLPLVYPFVRSTWCSDHWRPPEAVKLTSDECCDDVWWYHQCSKSLV
jgi:hypothetical protein